MVKNTNAYIGSITGDALKNTGSDDMQNNLLQQAQQSSSLGSPFYNNNPSPDSSPDLQPQLQQAATQADGLFGTQMAFGTHIAHPSNPLTGTPQQQPNLNNTPGITNPMPQQYNPTNAIIKPVQQQTQSPAIKTQQSKIPSNNVSNQALMGKIGSIKPSPMSGILSQGINQPQNIAQ